MTTSIVFDEIDYSELEYNASSSGNTMLTDPSASIIALQRLRYLKTRETGDDIVVPNTTGRDENQVIDFDYTTYEQYKMRRKSEVLRYQSNVVKGKKAKFSSISRTRRGQFKGVSDQRLKQSSEDSGDCGNDVIRVKLSVNSGIKCGNTPLYLDPGVTFIEKL
jgi:hypothetical protein